MIQSATLSYTAFGCIMISVTTRVLDFLNELELVWLVETPEP